ncbi:stalk domain-containing protein [Paenibacillus sp. VTT E-133291]
MIDGAVYVSLREMSDQFGAAIAWDNVTKTATITANAQAKEAK